MSTDATALNTRGRNEEDSILQQALTAASVGAWSYDIDDHTIWWSDGMYDLHGVDPASTDLSNDAKARVHEDDHSRMVGEMYEHIYHGKPIDTEFRVRHPEKGVRWLHSHGKIIITPQGTRKVIGVTQDVTDRKMAEEEIAAKSELLQRERERLDMALRATDLGVWHCDLPFNKLVWNKQVKQHFGIPEDAEVSIDMFYERIHPEDRQRVKSAIEQSISSDEHFDTVYRTVGLDGRVRFIRAMGSAFYAPDGIPLRFDGVTVDVTERMEAESALEERVEQRTAELKAINADLESFCYSVAHDLRAPLRAIIATSMILLQDSADNLKAEELELLQQQAKNAKRLSKLINDLLDHSRISRTPMSKGKCNLTDLVKGIVRDLEGAFPDKELHIEVEPDMQVNGDPLLLRAALSSLLDNACKFSPNPARIEVKSFEVDGERVYSVKDHGIGFDMRYAHKIFLPFEKLQRDDEYPGTGIGLANAQRIISRHGGRLWSESEIGKGSAFYFVL